MLAQTIQRQVTIGDNVKFTRRDGHEITGRLVELGKDHITLDSSGNSTTILMEMIGGWEVLKDTLSAANDDSKSKGVTPRQDGESEVTTEQDKDSEVKSINFSDKNLEEALKVTLEIEARFQASTAAQSLEPPFPSFDLAAKGVSGRQIKSVLDRLKSKYEYALKINELGSQYGRIQPLVSDLESLATRHPDSSKVSRLLAYFHWLTGNVSKALDIYKKVAVRTGSSKDWYSLAVLANDEAVSCFAFTKVYSQVAVSEYPAAWYTFVNLVAKFQCYSDIANLISNSELSKSEQDIKAIFEASVFLLMRTKNQDAATNFASRLLSGGKAADLATEAFTVLLNLGNVVSPEYIEVEDSFKPVEATKTVQRPSSRFPSNFLQGQIYSYKTNRNFGFIRGVDEKTYFFHRSAVSDEELGERLRDFYGRIAVIFEAADGPKGPIAFNISLPRDTEEVFKRAKGYAENGEYPQAINQIKKVLSQNPDYPSAVELHEKWRSYARTAIVPRGTNPYARAKRVQLIEKDLDGAVSLFEKAIRESDNFESAVKDLASLQVQRGNPHESIRILRKYRNQISDPQSVDNMLIGFHQKAGNYDEVLTLLEVKLRKAPSDGQKAQVLWQMANCHLQNQDYALAETRYRNVLELQPNVSASRNIAFCIFKQGHYEEAESLLKELIETSRDLQAEELLQAIRLEQEGKSSNIDEIAIEITLPNLSKDTSKLTAFFLEGCDFQGVPPSRVKEVQEQEAEFDSKDVQMLENLARRLGTQRPRERAEFFLSAAKILLTIEDSDPDEIYKYLGRSFALRADAAVVERKPLDAAKELYAESLSVYDGYRSGSSDDREASNALVRFLFATLGEGQIPLKPDIPSIDETLDTILNTYADQTRAFDAIAYLVYRCPRIAARRILERLFNKSLLQAKSIEYLKRREIEIVRLPNKAVDFVRLWYELQRKTAEESRQISSELRLMVSTEITTASIEDSIGRIGDIPLKLFLELDQDRFRELENILNTAHELCSQFTFEEQERLCNIIDMRCQDLLDEIETAPTKISIEELFPVVDSLKSKISERLENLYEQSTPHLTLQLALESYRPNSEGELNVQIEVSNRMGRSPAEALELVVVEQEESDFRLVTPEIKLDSSLRGDDQRILPVRLRVGREALKSQVFSLPIYAQFRSRSGDTDKTPLHNFSVRLYSEEDFKVIENRFAVHALGGPVEDPSMFFGRDVLITNVANSILSSRIQSKCVMIYGQYRTGKSSVLYHLKSKLQEEGNLLILDIGNIGAMLDPHSRLPLLYQILWTIIQELQDAVNDRLDAGFPRLALEFPSELEFYQHPTPLRAFGHLFQSLQRTALKRPEWKETSIVLLVDEFSYLHELIESGGLSDTFMKNWKALLERNFFNAVLVGQDVMPKFKQKFPNEFGTTQDERVTYLSRDDAKRLIDEPIRLDRPFGDSKSRYRGKAIDRIIELTAGSPYYIQILCSRLVDYMNRECSILVTEADVERVKDEMISGENSLEPDKFDNLISSGDTSADAISKVDALAVLEEIARNSNNSANSCRQDSISCRTESPLLQVLDDLERREVIKRQKLNYYSIQVGLFKEWLLAHQ